MITTRSDGLERSESNYFCTVISKILVKENIFYFMANLAARGITLLSHAYVQIGYQSIHIVFKAPRESYIETLGVLTFFLNMCVMVYDKNCIMMS